MPQNRSAAYLLGNNVAGAVSGLLFWFLLARVAGLPSAAVGVGYATVALGTLAGLVAKGGLDIALLRHVPGAGSAEGLRLFRLAALLGAALAAILTTCLAVAAWLGFGPPHLGAAEWALVGAIAVLLAVTWLQDARFLAEGDARPSFQRHLVLHVARLALPLPVLALGLPAPVPLTWALALAASAVAVAAVHRGPVAGPRGPRVPAGDFLGTAARNLPGSVAESLPGLLLAPLVLALDGPAAAGYFAIAWAGASVLFAASATIGRSTTMAIIVAGAGQEAAAVRQGLSQLVWLVAPAAVAGVLLAPHVLGVFGPAYAREGAVVFALLCASAVFVAPSSLYIAVLRARAGQVALVALPVAMIAALLLLVPPLAARLGIVGVAWAWLLANAPFGAYATMRLWRATREVKARGPAPTLRRAAHLE